MFKSASVREAWFWNPARPGGSTRDPTDPGLEPGRVEEKMREEKTRCDPTANPLAFIYFCFFFTETTWFWFFKKKLTWPTLWLDQNSESRSGTGPGLKTMERSVVCMKKKTKENICKKRKSLWHRSRIMAQPVFCWRWPTFMAWNNKVTLAGFSMAYDNHPCLLHNLEWHDFRFVYLLSHLYF